MKLNAFTRLLVLLLSTLLIFCILWKFTTFLKEKYSENDSMLLSIKQDMKPLHPDIEGLKLYKSDKSYTINKDKIYMCVKDNNNKYYPKNHLKYVFLHEFAHYLNKEDIGHTENFHRIFQDLIEKANALGIYDSSIPPLDKYCNY